VCIHCVPLRWRDVYGRCDRGKEGPGAAAQQQQRQAAQQSGRLGAGDDYCDW